jgi:hypothetical protein
MLVSVTAKTKVALLVTSLLLAVCAGNGCGGSQPAANAAQQVNLRLQGNWRLQSYRPTAALEAPLAAVLAIQFGQLRVAVNGSQISAQGPGLQVVRSYTIQEALDQTATLIVSEPTGVSIRVWVEFHDDVLTFRPLDAPWTGEGTLQRI